MNTLPSPSTVSPVKRSRPASSATWSGECPGVAIASNGPARSPSPRRVTPTPARSASAGAPSEWSWWSCVRTIPATSPPAAPSTASRWRSSAGPGSTTQPETTYVLVPSSVSGDGLSARTRATPSGTRSSVGAPLTLGGARRSLREERDRRREAVQEVAVAHRPDLARAEEAAGGRAPQRLLEHAGVVVRGAEHARPAAVAGEDQRAGGRRRQVARLARERHLEVLVGGRAVAHLHAHGLADAHVLADAQGARLVVDGQQP